MSEEDIKLLDDNGWIVICESPFEIEDSQDPQSGAQGSAAQFILDMIKILNEV